uniref:Zona pellucida sperm-binding protein 4 n=1 Tax=Neogobius melanostomus TaxID=47308 RepID=A0A8C6UKI5_9GOBI
MAFKLFSLCLLAVVLLGSLGQAQHFKPMDRQGPQKPQPPQPPQPPQNPQNPQNPQYPQTPQRPQRPNTPQQPVFPTCEVPQQHKIQCGPPGITASKCQEINCCFDGQMCYYGKAVTLQCTKDGQFIVVIARDATLPNIDLDSIDFLGTDQNCEPVATTSAFAIYQFPVTGCGTTMTETDLNVITYENRMSCSYEVAVGPYGAITRDSQFDLVVQCRYTGSSVQALVIDVRVLDTYVLPVAAPGRLRVELRLGNGICTAKGCIEADVAYNSYYMEGEYPVTKVLRDPVYVEVRMLERTDPNLVLTLGRCWATASPNPLSLPQWDLLVDGCPYRDDRYQTNLVRVVGSPVLEFPTHYRRFIFKMFTFVASGSSNPTKKVLEDPILTPIREMLYVHCNTAVCRPSSMDNCEPRCFRRKRDVAASVKSSSRGESITVTSPGIIFTMSKDEQ